MHAIIGASLAIPLDQWCDGHEDQFLRLVADASRRLATRGHITAQQAAGWLVIDGTPIIRGTYPQAQAGHRWYFGVPGGTRTIQMRRQDPPHC